MWGTATPMMKKSKPSSMVPREASNRDFLCRGVTRALTDDVSHFRIQ